MANALLLVPFVLNYEGIRLFLGKGRRFNTPLIIVLAIFALAFGYFAFITYSVSARIIIVCLVSAVMCGLTARTLLHKAPPDIAIPLAVTSGGFILYGLFCLVRIFRVLTGPPIENLLQGGLIHGLTFFVANVMVAVNGLGILWVAGARLENELSRQARIDSLTGLYNRRALDELAEREVSRSIRNGSPLSVIMADVDHFKPINDKLGHKAGDMVLSAVAAVMSRCLRKQDIIARYGGEEFIAILPDTDKSQAIHVAEKLRAVFPEEVFHGNGADIILTLSFGISSLGEDRETVDQLIDGADDALYRAKQQGRNRAVAL